MKRGYSRSRANLNGGELDCENTSGTHKGSHKRRGALCKGQSKWWRAGRGTVSPIRPRTNLNGGDLVRSTVLVFIFTFTLAFLATLVLAFIFALFASFTGSILTFLGCIMNLGRGIPFGSFGRAFARAHCALRRGLAFHGSSLKAGIHCARRGVRKDGAAVEEGWLSQWGARIMPIGRGRSGGGVRLRPVSGMRGEGGGVLPRGAGASGHWWWCWKRNEHSYSHWLSLDLPAGWWDLARLLFMHPDAASATKRDATPL